MSNPFEGFKWQLVHRLDLRRNRVTGEPLASLTLRSHVRPLSSSSVVPAKGSGRSETVTGPSAPLSRNQHKRSQSTGTAGETDGAPDPALLTARILRASDELGDASAAATRAH